MYYAYVYTSILANARCRIPTLVKSSGAPLYFSPSCIEGSAHAVEQTIDRCRTNGHIRLCLFI